MIKALVFDFDGLILDTAYPEYHSWQLIYREFDLQLPIELWAAGVFKSSDSIVPTPYDDLEARLGRSIDRAEIRVRRRAHFHELMRSETILPGVQQILTAGRALGLGIAIASSSPRDWVIGYLEQVDLHAYFDVLWCGDDVVRTKPDPELYLSAIGSLGCAPSEAIAFEDSATGVKAAKAAGLYCVAVPNRLTVHAILDQADLRIGSLAELSLEQLVSCR